MLTLAEEILVLLIDEEGAFLPVSKHVLKRTLTGAVLMDLAFEHRIDTDTERLMIIDPTPTGNAVLDAVLRRIVESEEEKPAVDWLESLSSDEAPAIRQQALVSLEERNIIERRDDRRPWLFWRHRHRYSIMDNEIGRDARMHLSTLLFSDEIPEPRNIALISLADACGILRTVFDEREMERSRQRIEMLERMDLIGRAVLARISVWKLGYGAKGRDGKRDG